ncbi:immunity 22 family protein [Pedobacter sp. NJ-S-72]
MAQQSIHVWAGTSEKTEEQFYKYFDQSKFLKNTEDLNLRSQFSKDLNLQNSYDEDWITIFHNKKKRSAFNPLLRSCQYGMIKPK